MSERGLCAIFLGDDPQALVHELQDRFPKADLIGGDGEFEQLVAQVVELCGNARDRAGSTPGCARDRFSAAGLAGAAPNPTWTDSHLR